MNIVLRRQLMSKVGKITTISMVDCFFRSWSTLCCCTTAALRPLRPVLQTASLATGKPWHIPMNPNDFIAASLIDSVTFETVCADTLESLCDYFEQLIEETSSLKNADVTYGDGVLTVKFGAPHGTYVINRQSPNRQIWLSSPTSGPKRYDFVPDKSTINEGFWLYRHDDVTLHQLLQEEISVITGRKLDFFALPHSKRPKNA